MENGGGGALPAPMLVPTSRLIRSLSVRLPLLDFHNSSFDDCGSFARWSGQVKWLPSGYVALAAAVVLLRFEVCWANQFWELFEFDPRRQHPQMLRNIEHIIASLDKPSAEMMVLDDASMGTAALPVLRASPPGVTYCIMRSNPWTSLCCFLFVGCGAVSSLLAAFRGWKASLEFFDVEDGEMAEEAVLEVHEEYVASAGTPPASPDSGAGAGLETSRTSPRGRDVPTSVFKAGCRDAILVAQRVDPHLCAGRMSAPLLSQLVGVLTVLVWARE